MTREEANKILDEHKYGDRIHSIIEITQALWVTGDLGHVVPKATEPSRPVVFSEGFQRVRLGKSERTGKEPLRLVQGNID